MKKRLSKIIVTVLCLMSMVALLPSTVSAAGITGQTLIAFSVGLQADSPDYYANEAVGTLSCNSALPTGIQFRHVFGNAWDFYGTAAAGTVGDHSATVENSDGGTLTVTIRISAGPQTIVQPDISKRITDGSFTVTPQSKDGNGDVIDVATAVPTLVNPENHQPTYTFSSSDPTIATINSTTGEVTLVAEGTTTITVNSAATESYTAADPITFDLTVTPEVSNPPAKKDVPQTDDTTSILPSAVVGIAALGLLILLVNRKKKKA